MELEKREEHVLVSAPTKAGEAFIKQLKYRGITVAGLTNNKVERKRLEKAGAVQTVLVDTHNQDTWKIPPFSLGDIYLFERSFNLCCQYIVMCRAWTVKPIFVITTSINSRLVYRGLGASQVFYSYSGDATFLVKGRNER
ncbi:MAG: hypothetical protein K6T85_10155 [Gorillibacterium sp.]|nr:hypothetical protein [Gorillibacterium sp.]